ncbi:hypothetical protein AWM68_08660 [Fictibacillus phosphorivorans]|uniref:Uncharacterized protein n=1 Tax=Fictibacillus phosphorivorans TaxID=1221500 RepID=A0A163R9V9_9BACL|nr:hypothetical protein AWM68_08660 [Fictibacillus phosphorivorans]
MGARNLQKVVGSWINSKNFWMISQNLWIDPSFSLIQEQNSWVKILNTLARIRNRDVITYSNLLFIYNLTEKSISFQLRYELVGDGEG